MVSGQWSVISRVFSGDPQGSAFQLRNAEFGLRNRERITNHESRTTGYESPVPPPADLRPPPRAPTAVLSPWSSDLRPASRSPVAEEEGEVGGADDVIVVKVGGVVGVRAPIAQENG